MLSFTVTKPRQTLERQWTFLLEKVYRDKCNSIKKRFIGLLLATSIYVLFYFFTAVDNYIVFKVLAMFLIALAWCALTIQAILYMFYKFLKAKKKRRLQWFFDSISDEQLSYSVVIDDEKVVIGSISQTQVYPWTDFSCFAINEETIYVLNKVQGINSLYWDKSEIGNDNYSSLLEMLKKKEIRQSFWPK